MDASYVSSLHDSEDYHIVKSNSTEPLDRLSELPDSLIFVILSLLETRDVVRTTILSKRWKDLWTIVPCLHFRHTTYNNLDEFPAFVCWVLARWKGAKILKFRIDILFYLSMADVIDFLLLFAISNQVEELHIELARIFVPYESQSNYCAPQRLYSCSSITKLSLVSVELNIGESVEWNQLKRLTMDGVYALTEYALNQILSGAPLLEVLNLCIRGDGDNLNIRSTSLKMLKIEMYNIGLNYIVESETVLRIWAPNLETLEISGLLYTRCLFNVPSLISAILGFDELDYFILLGEMLRQVFLSICHVEKLSLTDWCIKVLLEMKTDTFVLFSNAKFLKLYPVEADEMLDVLEMFPELMILVFEHNELVQQLQFNSFFQVNSMAPNRIFSSLSLLQLKTIEITWPIHDASIIPVIEILLENAQVLEKMVLRLRTHQTNPETTFVLAEEKVLSMRRASSYANVIVCEDS